MRTILVFNSEVFSAERLDDSCSDCSMEKYITEFIKTTCQCSKWKDVKNGTWDSRKNVSLKIHLILFMHPRIYIGIYHFHCKVALARALCYVTHMHHTHKINHRDRETSAATLPTFSLDLVSD